MVKLGTSEFKAGLKIIIDDDPCVILESEFVKPGKGQAFTRIKFRNLKTERVLERRYKSGQSLVAADIVERTVQYLYNDSAKWYFMDQTSFEQYSVEKAMMSTVAQWLIGEEQCVIMLWNNMPLAVQPPNFVMLKVAETEPEFKGDTAAGAVKPATLETGATVKVPLFIATGERIKIDTRNGSYVGRG